MKGVICVLLKVVISEKSALHVDRFIEVNTTVKGWNGAGIRNAIDLAVTQINNETTSTIMFFSRVESTQEYTI